MRFSERLKELRSDKQCTQKQLASYLGLTANSICEWENNRSEPSIETLSKLSIYFDVSVDYLLGLVDDFGIKITPEERAEGASEVKRIYVTPKEDELVYLFREVGKRHGAKAQSAILEMADNLLKL